MPVTKSKMTDTEITEVGDLLKRIQAVLEDREKNYSSLSVLNVLVNLVARYAVVEKWPQRNFKKVCEQAYRTQKADISRLEKKKLEDEQQQQSPAAN